MIEKNNLLLSFPRSGNSWIRYFLEFISKRPTSIGTVKDCQKGSIKTDPLSIKLNLGVDIGEKCVVIKRHRADHGWDNWAKDTCNLVFLMRDPYEAILRHMEPHQKNKDSELNKLVEGYLHCLDFYDKFDGRKCLVTYEDLLNKPFVEITKIIEFLGVEKGPHFHSFFKDFEKHRSRSAQTYHGGSQTGGHKTKLKYHSRKYGMGFTNKIKNKLKKKGPDLYDKYLKRYE